jgi:hypothetical protein
MNKEIRKLFSLRQRKNLEEGSIKVSLERKFRRALLKNLESFVEDYTLVPYGESRSTWDDVSEHLERCTGEPPQAFVEGAKGQKLRESTVPDAILLGLPQQVFDIIEAFLDLLSGENLVKCREVINKSFENHNLPWRVIENSIILIDSNYFAEEVQAKALHLLGINGYEGAQKEFQAAVEKLNSGESRDAIQYAYASLESTLKALTGKNSGTLIELFRDLTEKVEIPAWYGKYIKSIEEICGAFSADANQPGVRHGAGLKEKELERPTAKLAVNISGSLILYLVEAFLKASEETNVAGEILSNNSNPVIPILSNGEIDTDDISAVNEEMRSFEDSSNGGEIL